MDGVAKIVLKNQEDPSKAPINIYKQKGEYFGEIALIVDSKRTADVVAAGEIYLFFI
jgi:CRP-like cAMP-binding protein